MTVSSVFSPKEKTKGMGAAVTMRNPYLGETSRKKIRIWGRDNDEKSVFCAKNRVGVWLLVGKLPSSLAVFFNE